MADSISNQPCPICGENTCTLTEELVEVPYFGKVYIFSMSCSACKYSKSDVECAERKDPIKYTFEIENQKDLNTRIVKSSEGTIKIPHMITVESGPESDGYVSNIEGVLLKIKNILEKTRNDAEDDADKKKAKNMLKKLNKVLWGNEKLKIILEDPSGNSAIISDKAKIEKLKKR